MSATTLDNPTVRTLQQDYLQDYNIRLTGDSDLRRPEKTNKQQQQQQEEEEEQQQQQQQQRQEQQDGSIEAALARRANDGPYAAPEYPAHWPQTHRQIPPYRPVNRQLDLASRPWGDGRIGTVFVMHMFTGVWLEAVSVVWLVRLVRLLRLLLVRGSAGVARREADFFNTDGILGMEEDRRQAERQLFQVQDWRGDLRARATVHGWKESIVGQFPVHCKVDSESSKCARRLGFV